MPASGSPEPSQCSSARAPKPVGPVVHSWCSVGESPTEAMSRWAHGTSPTKCCRNSAAVIAPGAARGVVGVGDLGGELVLVVLDQRESATAARRRRRRRRAIAGGERRRRLAKKPPVRWPRATFIAPVRVATSTSASGVELGDGVRERVGEHQPALGVGVGDLGGAAAVVARSRRRGAARRRRRRSRRPATSPVTRTGQSTAASARQHRHHDGAAGHVALHGRPSPRPGLMRQAAGVEGDALADQHDVRASCAPRPGGRVVEPDQARRRRRRLADADDAAEALARRARVSSQTVAFRPCLGGQATGLVGQPLRGS